MERFRFLCIAPYDGMYHLMNNIAEQRSDVELIIRMGNLDDGLKVVLENLDERIDAIISRGGTAESIRRHIDIPACDIVPSVYDVLRTIRLAGGMNERFAVVGYPSITKPATMLCDIMRYEYKVYTIHSPEDCERQLQQLRNEGISIIVGDMISVSCARQLGLQGLLIISGMESVENAIDSAKKLCQHHAVLNEKVDLLSSILTVTKNEYMVYSLDGQKVFSTVRDLPDSVIVLLSNMISTVIAQKSITRVVQVGSVSYSIHGRALNVRNEEFCLYSIVSNISKSPIDKHRIQYLTVNSDLPSRSKPLEYYWGRSETSERILNTCERFASMKGPVLIEGERGTGKARVAHHIYSHSALKHNSFLYIDAETLEERDWSYLLDSTSSPLTNIGLSIYFHRINAAAPKFQALLYDYLKVAPISFNRLYFSYSGSPQHTAQENLYLYLTDVLHCLRLRLPGLDKHREDIPTLVSLYINAINIAQGTRVIGFTNEAMILLQNNLWQRNADQLFEVVQDLVIQADTSYISDDSVKRVISPKRSKASAFFHENGIDLNRSLDEITRDIILKVYIDENNNQARTAKRLKISRSTLWRLLPGM